MKWMGSAPRANDSFLLKILEQWPWIYSGVRLKAIKMRFYQLVMLLCGLIFCHSLVKAQFGWRCGYVGGWCGSEKWRGRESSGGFRSKARLMAALARSVREHLAE
ncbi:hypothetical protein V3C99_015962 [Haemonchus contortus]